MAGRSEEQTGWGETHQRTLKDLVDAQIARLKETTDLAVVAEVEKISKAYMTVARTVKAVETMIPEPKAKPVASAATDDEEAPMHDGIPDDPEELSAALTERFALVADIIEQKRLAAVEGGAGKAGSAVRAERGERAAAGTSAGSG